jgi:hypothetical protein
MKPAIALATAALIAAVLYIGQPPETYRGMPVTDTSKADKIN